MASYLFRRLIAVSPKKFTGSALALLLGVSLVTVGCHQAITDPKDPKFIVAEKGDWHILRGELDSEIASYMQQNHITPEQIGPQKMPILETAMLDNIILKKLLLDKAAALQLKDLDKEEADQLTKIKGPTNDKDFEQQLQSAGLTVDELKKRIHEKVLINKVLEAEAFKNSEPTEQEINDIYLKNKEHFVIPPKVRASRVLLLVNDKTTASDKVAKKKAIDKARARVVKGEDFAKVATEISEDRYSAPKGGDIGYFQQGENESQSFDDVAFNTKLGVVSPVFETPLGYQFLKVTDTKPAGVVPVSEAREFISGKLRQMKMGQQQEAYSKKVLADSGVVYHLVRAEMPATPEASTTPPQPAGEADPAPGGPAPGPEAAPAPPKAPAPSAPSSSKFGL